MKDLIVVQARMGSTRLPGKMLLDLNGMPAIIYLLNRLKSSFDKNSILVATTTNSVDDILYDTIISAGFNCYRGDENNVLSRFVNISEEFNFTQNIIRLTGDNVLIDLDLIKYALVIHKKGNSDLTSTRRLKGKNIVRKTPKGQSVDIFRASSLRNLDISHLDEFDLEHVIPLFYREPFKFILVENKLEFNNAVSLDTIEDYHEILGLV